MGTLALWGRDGAAEDEEDEDEELLLLLRRASAPVLDILSLRRLARGAFSTLFRKKPSRFPLLKAWRWRRERKKESQLVRSLGG